MLVACHFLVMLATWQGLTPALPLSKGQQQLKIMDGWMPVTFYYVYKTFFSL